MPSGTAYAVTIATQPASQSCSLAGGTGSVGAAHVTSVSVTCQAPSFRIGGTVTGLLGSGLTLRLNGSVNVTVAAGAASFTFPDSYATGTTYSVTVATQPTGPAQVCSLAAGSGTVTNADVQLQVSCGFPVSGTHGVTVLRANGGVLLLNGEAPVDLIVDRPTFTFPLGLPAGTPYAVTVGRRPSGPGHTCTVQNGSGIMGNGPVTNITVVCLADGLIIGGPIQGYTGSGLTLRINDRAPRRSIAMGARASRPRWAYLSPTW